MMISRYETHPDPTSTDRRFVLWFAVGLAVLGIGLRASPTSQAQEASESAEAEPSALNRINAQLREGWDAAGVRPSPEVDDAAFLRRASLDLLGRVPTLKETAFFMSRSDPEKRRKLIEAMLQHPDYAKNFSNLWTVILIGRGDPGDRVNRGALRTWLRSQFANNRPWDEIVRELITAEGPNTPENGATNFALAHMGFDQVPLTSVTTRVFLGQQIQCTQCHDHPMNSWKQADFWGINAFFRGLDSRRIRDTNAAGAVETVGYELFERPTDAFARFDRRNGMVEITYPTYLDGRRIPPEEKTERREKLAAFMTDPEDQQLARAFVNRMWGHFHGRGIVHPADDFGDHNPATLPELLDELAEEFHASGYDIQELIRLITASVSYQRSSAGGSATEPEGYFHRMKLKPMTPEQLFESLLVVTRAHEMGGPDESDKRRDRWLRQFVFTFSTDEVRDGTSFEGTIPQALMMMNGDLIDEATRCKPGSFLRHLLDEARSRNASADFLIDRIYLAALTRKPSSKERTAARSLIQAGGPVAGMEDLFWALLNSNEFIFNH